MTFSFTSTAIQQQSSYSSSTRVGVRVTWSCVVLPVVREYIDINGVQAPRIGSYAYYTRYSIENTINCNQRVRYCAVRKNRVYSRESLLLRRASRFTSTPSSLQLTNLCEAPTYCSRWLLERRDCATTRLIRSHVRQIWG